MTDFQEAIFKLLPRHRNYAMGVVHITRKHYGGNGNKGQRSAVKKALTQLWHDGKVNFTYGGYPEKKTRYYRKEQ